MSERIEANLNNSDNTASELEVLIPLNFDIVFNTSVIGQTQNKPPKKRVKFILTKLYPSASLLQKKKILDRENSNNGRWKKEEQKRFAEAIFKYGNHWKKIQSYVSSRNITQIRSHAQKFLMKLKENNFLKMKGIPKYLSWKKVMIFLKNSLTNEELRDALFSVEQTKRKRSCRRKTKRIRKNLKILENQKSNLNINNELQNNLFCCDKKDFNFDLDENNTIKMIEKDEEEERDFQKFIQYLNPRSGEITSISSFEEKSKKEAQDHENYLNLFSLESNCIKFNDNYY